MTEPTLIHKYLPDYTFNEIHSIEIDSPAETVYQAAKDFDMSKSKWIKGLFMMRGLPTSRMNLQGFIADVGFTPLEENPPTENLLGFWARTKIEPIPGYEAFIANTISPGIKVVWNFLLEKISDSRTRLSTETRVLCVSPLSKVTFPLYWMIIKPFSGLIRTRMLRIIKEETELQENLGR